MDLTRHAKGESHHVVIGREWNARLFVSFNELVEAIVINPRVPCPIDLELVLYSEDEHHQGNALMVVSVCVGETPFDSYSCALSLWFTSLFARGLIPRASLTGIIHLRS